MNDFIIMLETIRGAGWVFLLTVLVLSVGLMISEIRAQRTASHSRTKRRARERRLAA